MDVLIKIAQLIVALSLLVVVHEFGHYVFARIFGIRVEKFYLFFNPWFTPVKWKPKEPKQRKTDKHGNPCQSWRDTEYGIGWIPLGGYCKIAGMIDESMDKDAMAQPPKRDEFRSRPAYQRLLVMLGGVIFNFLLAIIIYIGIAIHWGKDYIPYDKAVEGMNFTNEAIDAGYRNGDIIVAADGHSLKGQKLDEYALMDAKEVTVLRDGEEVVVKNPDNFPVAAKDGMFDKDQTVNAINPYRLPVYIGQFTSGSVAEKAGFKEGDHIVGINGQPIHCYTELVPALKAASDHETEVQVIREGSDEPITINVVPKNGKLGFRLMDPSLIFEMNNERYNVFQAVPVGISDGTRRLVTYVSSLKYVFTKEGASEIGGFGAIGSLFPAKWDWYTFWQLCAFLSVILAFMNVLPIPALDGGHALFVLWEMVTRRKPSEKFLERAQIVGMVLLLLLLLYANGNDIYKLFK